MLDRIKNKFSKNRAYQINDLLDQVDNAVKKYSYLAICPENTGANWLGIKNATYSIFNDATLVLPQYYSNQIVSDEDFNILITHFKSSGGKHLIFNGYPSYFKRFIEIGNQHQLKTSLVYHGGLAENNQNTGKQKSLSDLFQQAREGKINQFGLVKKGLEELFGLKSNIPCKRIFAPVKIPSDVNSNKINDGKIHIGVFGNNTYNKNRHTQVAAAALIKNSIVHISGDNEFDYLLPPERIVIHKQLDKKDFLKLLGQMQINLYCSYSESWGQVALESLAMKTPCLISNNSGILDWNNELQKLLTVGEYDNIESIKSQINQVLNKQDLVNESGIKYVNQINEIAEKKLLDFVRLEE